MPAVLKLAKLEDQRWGLIRFIEEHRLQGSANNSLTVVFDGNLDIFGGMISSSAKIVFSKGESADDKIKRIVAQTKNTKNVVVVSDDRSIQYAVRALGAKVSSVRAFLDQVKKPVGNNSSTPEKGISRGDQHKINSEVEAIWLGSKKKKKD